MSKSDLEVGIRPPSWIDNVEGFDEITDWVVRAEQLGFDSVHAGDRFLAEVPPIYQSTMYEVTTSLTTWASHTDSIMLSPLIFVVPFRNPIQIAKVFGTMDIASNGRIILGVGNGWNPHEFDALSISKNERGQRLEESVEIIRELWTNDHVNYDSEIFEFNDVTIKPKPIQDPHPPIWFGSFGPHVEEFTSVVEHVLKRVGRLGDGWVPLTYSTDSKEMLDPKKLAQGWEIIANEAHNQGRDSNDIEMIYSHWSYVMEDEEEEQTECMKALSSWFDGTYAEGKNTYLIGTAEEIVEDIKRATSNLPRVDRFIFTPFTMDNKQQNRLSNKVRPLLEQEF